MVDFTELYARAREGAERRERERDLPRGLIRDLLLAGFGSARVPTRAGGEGADLETLFTRIVDLAAADSNVAHVFRGHLAFVEQLHFEPDAERRDLWHGRVLAGDFVGNAQSEVSGTSDLSTTLTETPDGLVLNGRKFYTTGSIYADWIDLAARYRDEDHQVIVSTRHEGVESVDDWTGFGQLLTGSGTTTFRDVPVEASEIRPYAADHDGARHPYLMGFFQLVLLAVIAGIGRGAADDAVTFVRPRTRIFGFAGQALPRQNELVQAVVGRLSTAAFAARAIVLECARGLDRALADHLAGRGDPAAFVRAQLDVYRAQQTVPALVIDATSELFEVGGASAVDRDLALDRHWRNARTIATHNPAIHRLRAIGDWELNAVEPPWGVSAPPRPGGAR